MVHWFLLPNSIPSYEYTALCLLFYSRLNCFHFGATVNNTAINFIWMSVFISPGSMPKNPVAYVNSILNLLRNSYTVV